MAEENGHEVPPGTVVVGVDGSPSAHTALGWAIDQATAEHRPLTLVHAEARRATTGGRAVLDHSYDEVSKRAPTLEVHRLLSVSEPRRLLLDLSADAALVVVGSRGRGPVRSVLLGSVGVAVARHASCPRVVVRPGHPGLVRHGVLVGVDGGQRSRGTLEFAFRQASLHRIPLTVLHTYVDSIVYGGVAGAPVPSMSDVRLDDLERERRLLAESMSRLQEKHPDVRVRAELAPGQPVEQLLERAARMNLVVVGSHDRSTASELLFGSVAAHVVEHASCPVAIVPVGQC